ncbi:hypothetical protein ACS0TY_009265 [Phlomoides rotata]
MMDVEPMVIDGADERKPSIGGATKKKRKRPEPEEKLAKISEFRDEVNSLVKYCKDLASENRGAWLENAEKVGNSSASLDGVIACLMEESDLPLSKLVDEIYEKVGNGDGVSKAKVKNIVLTIGSRSCYGVKSEDADVLEDEDESSLWCWETRDLKLMPKSARVSLRVRQTCRTKIHERITAVSAMINALEKSENYPNSQQELVKASEKLSKVLNELDIRLLMESMSNKIGVEMAEKEAEREEKLLIKQMERKKKETEIERKKKDRELQLEKLQSEKELKLLHDEAGKEGRRREKEEIDIQKQLKRKQEKDQRRREKEKAELKEQLATQKQASLMERFLKRSKTNSSSQNDSSAKKDTISGSSSNMLARIPESVTLVMDSVLAQNDGIEVQDIWKSHLNAWRSSRCSINSNRKRHWGIRRKPKSELIKELKLSTNKELTCEEDFSMEKFVVGWEDSNNDKSFSQTNTVNSPVPCGKKRVPVNQLLQFDKSNRPAFYGVWPRKSQVVGPHRPFVKDPDIEYDIDSDEEWEEDEPGESLSDCDKDDDDEEGDLKDDDGDESEDGFFVPDGYLSGNEGATADAENLDLVEEVQDPSPEFCTMLRQQKYLNNVTEHALRKNQPLIILNLTHDKTTLVSAEVLTGIAKLEKTVMQTLCIRPFPGSVDLEISVPNDVVDEDQKASSGKSSTSSLATGAALLDSDLPQIISIIQSSAHSIGKIEKSLRNKFPAVPISQLRNKVREISEFSGNRWQVKKEILSKHGMNISTEKSSPKMKSITTYLEKRCHPPSGETKKTSRTSPQSSKKPRANVGPQQDSSS